MSGNGGTQSNTPSNPPVVRTDLVDVYVFRTPTTTAGLSVELLQLRRCDEPGDSLHGTWQPVMGHVEGAETAPEAALRELAEETGLVAMFGEGPGEAGPGGVAVLFALEQVHPFYLASRNAIMCSPRFAVEAPGDWEPRLNHEHDAARWVLIENAGERFMWPGQRACIAELRERLKKS